MTKRFSITAFIVATILHLGGAWVLLDAGFRAMAEFRRTGVYPHGVLLNAVGWIWEPLPRLVQRWCVTRDAHAISPSACQLLVPSFLIWALCVGVICGFVTPPVIRWLGKSSNQAMQRTAPRSDA